MGQNPSLATDRGSAGEEIRYLMKYEGSSLCPWELAILFYPKAVRFKQFI
jgi:hypothetical protein